MDIQIDEFKNIIENIKNDIKNTRFKILEEANVELLNLDEYEIIKEGTYPRTDNLIVKDEVLDNPGDSYTYALKFIF